MKHLAIAILSQIESPTITENLKPALEALGHSVSIYDISSVTINDLRKNPIISQLKSYDLVYYRTGLLPDAAAILQKYLSEEKVLSVNLDFTAHPHVASKTYQVQIVSKAGFLTPLTLLDRTSTFEQICAKIGNPFVAKANRSSQGKDVHLINNQAALDAIAPDIKVLEYFFQAYVPHQSEYRVHVVGTKAAALYQRVPTPGDFRSNVTRGGTMTPVEGKYHDTLSKQAIAIATLFGFEITAVDFMRHQESGMFYFTEINLNPGWEISDKEATGVDLSPVVAKYLENACF